MAGDNTAGYDMLVQVSENELNTQLATAFMSGGVLPPTIRVPVNQNGVVGTADVNFSTPMADLDRNRPGVGLTLPFSGSQLEITQPAAVMLAPLGGDIVIVDTLAMVAQASSKIARMDFNTGAPTVSVAFDAASQAILTPALRAAGISITQAQNIMAGAVLRQLQSSVGNVDFTPPIAVVDDSDPTTVFDIDVTTVNDPSVADRDCVTFGIKTGSDSGGNINLVNASFIPPGSESLLMMSNLWLLSRVVRPRMAAALGLLVTDFDTPLRLNHSVAAPGGQGVLTALEARVENNRIRVDGSASASGTGWSARSDFTFFIDIGLSGGALTITGSTPQVRTDVDLEWWVWLASAALGGLFGGIIGAIVAVIVLAIVEAIANGVVSGLVSGGLSGGLSAIPALPLGPIGSALALAAVALDDLQLTTSIVRSISVPIKNQGSRASFDGFTLDLDAGVVRTDVTWDTDLVWDPSKGLSTRSPSGLTITGTPYRELTPLQVSRLPLAARLVPLTLIPLSLPPGGVFLSHSEVVISVRTSLGRLAKVSLWRSLDGAVHLDWVTFDTPASKLDINASWYVAERGEVRQYITDDCSFCRSSHVRWCGEFEAWPRLMAFPVNYEWCLCGNVLKDGEGTINSAGGILKYKLQGRRLCIEATQLGQSVDCELCVSAIDSRNVELFTCIQLSQPAVDTQCRKCTPDRKDVRVDVVPAESAVSNWRPLIAVRRPKS